MESTIRQLLDYGRRNPLTTRIVAAAQPLLSALKTVETETNHCGDKKVTVEMAAPARTTKIRIDPLRLEQALLNLVRNAMYAAHNNLTVGCSVSQDNILYWVQDDGPGIPAEALPHLFEPFFTTKPTGQGNGLGLAVAQAAANDHQGSIEIVENAPGCTRFHLILPRTEGTPK